MCRYLFVYISHPIVRVRIKREKRTQKGKRFFRKSGHVLHKPLETRMEYGLAVLKHFLGLAHPIQKTAQNSRTPRPEKDGFRLGALKSGPPSPLPQQSLLVSKKARCRAYQSSRLTSVFTTWPLGTAARIRSTDSLGCLGFNGQPGR